MTEKQLKRRGGDNNNKKREKFKHNQICAIITNKIIVTTDELN